MLGSLVRIPHPARWCGSVCREGITMRPDGSTWQILLIASAILGAVGACAGGAGPSVRTPGTVIESAAPSEVSATPTAESATRSAESATPSATPKPPPTGTPRPSAVVDVLNASGAGWAMALAGGALWIQVDPPVDAIVRIDLDTGTTEAVAPKGRTARAGSGGLWVACCDGIARLDPDTGDHLVDLGMQGKFTVGDDGVWIYTESAGLQQVDPETGELSASIGPIDGSACTQGWKDLVVAFGSAWLACKNGFVVRIDIESATSTVLTTGEGAHTFALSDDAVWVTNYQSNGVSRIDPETNEVLTIPGAGSGVGITYGDGFIWASTGTGIAQIDPEAGSIVREISLGSGGWFYELVWDDGLIWASTTTADVLKVDPYR
jgi:hypothetical protein